MLHYPTIVIHGFLANALTNLPIHIALRRKGLETHDVPIPGLNTINVERGTQILADKVNQVLSESASSRVNLVGVSKGGVIALNYLRRYQGHKVTHKAIMLGSPLNGTPIVGKIHKLPGIGKHAAELLPNSRLMQQLHGTAPVNSTSTAEVISIYADGDVLVNKNAATVPEARVVKAPKGVWPLGHYQLVVDPANLQLIAAELTNQQFETIKLSG